MRKLLEKLSQKRINKMNVSQTINVIRKEERNVYPQEAASTIAMQ